ncbi:MAG: sigma-70 family RNA polymerase sigma factor [Parabacteroides sp.]|nr:sigma-70 family RNA polymerase sigma factor [Parabacteroides sp.]
MLAKSHCIMNVSTPDYTSLFSKFKEGDDHAFSFFYEFYINDLYAYGISLGGEKEVVKDAVQDIFLKIYFEKKDFSSVDHLKYFLLKSLKNRLYNVHKSKAVSTTTGISSDVHGFSITTTVLDRIIDEEDRTIIKEQIDDLLSKLTARQKEAIYLRFMQEMEYEEIAEIMEMTPHAARKLISRSLKRMRDDEQLMLICFFMLILP